MTSCRKEKIEVVLSEEQIRRRVAELGRQITRDYRGRDLVVVCVLKGSFVFTADLIRHIDLPLTVDFLRTSSYGDNTDTCGSVRVEFDVTQSLKGKDVILVEDIIDTGHTVHAVMDGLAAKKPASLAICALLHKPEREKVRVPIDYLGFTIPNKFVVGYGLDHASRYRNLRYVGAVEA
ncbi:MAG: hypoxanthine phosphoribosyltransferase [Planctomycetes bacterium]|nr:hypoxanthine phosphoribosyltransferase [Planctomycetota bacterium]